MNDKVVIVIPLYTSKENISQTITSVFVQDISVPVTVVLVGCNASTILERVDLEGCPSGMCVQAMDVAADANLLVMLAEVTREYPADYVAILSASSYWKKNDYLGSAVQFLQENPQFSTYETNSEFVHNDVACGALVDLEKVSGNGTYEREFIIHTAGEYFADFLVVGHNMVFRNYFFMRENYDELMEMFSAHVSCEETNLELLLLLNLKFGHIKYWNEVVEVIASGEVVHALPLYQMVNRLYTYLTCANWYETAYGNKFKIRAVNMFQQLNRVLVQFEQEGLDVPDVVLNKIWSVSEDIAGFGSVKENQLYCFGDKNPDKIFFVMYASVRNWGLYTSMFEVLTGIDYALNNGWIPMIDFKHYYMFTLQDENTMFRENAWELYYKQPTDQYTLEEVYESKNVILSDLQRFSPMVGPDWRGLFPAGKEDLHKWNRYLVEHCPLQDQIQAEVEAQYKRFGFGEKRVLGVAFRMEYYALHLAYSPVIKNHSRQNAIEAYIDDVKKHMQGWNCDYVFASIDDAETLEKLKDIFGDKCLYMERPRMQLFKDGKLVESQEEKLFAWKGITTAEKNRLYVEEIHLLSMCNALYCGDGSGYRVAYFLNGGRYEYCEICKEGVY